MTQFPNVKAWPDQAAAPTPLKSNEPPLEDRLTMAFEDDLFALKARIDDLVASAGRVPESCDNETVAGKIGDLLKMGRVVSQEIDAKRETHNRPLLNAQRALKGRADAVKAPLDAAMNGAKRKVDAFVQEQARLRQEAARKEAEEHNRRAAEAREDGAMDFPATPPVATAPEPAPLVRGDLGSSVGTRTVWKFAREVPAKSLPKAILENATVLEAIDKVLGQMVRSGTREIKGVRIWSETASSVR